MREGKAIYADKKAREREKGRSVVLERSLLYMLLRGQCTEHVRISEAV